MSATNTKRKKQPAPAPVIGNWGAGVRLTLGMLLLTLGLASAVSLADPQSSSVLNQLYWALLGLCGPLCPGLAFLLIWGGAKLLVSSRHQVSARHFLLAAALYVLVLTGYTLIARVQLNGGVSLSYLDYVRQQAILSGFGTKDEYAASLTQAYLQRSTGAGGWLGMLVAYPLAQALTRVGACLLVGALILVLLAVILRLRPGRLFHAVSDFWARQEQKRSMEGGEQPAGDGIPQPFAPAYAVRTGPMYSARPAFAPEPQTEGGQQFYPVQSDLYEERFPEDEKRPAMEQPAWRNAPASAGGAKEAPPPAEKEEKPGVVSGLLNWLKKPEGAAPAPAPAPEAAEAPAREKPRPQEKPRRAAPAPVVSSGQALDEEDDDLPWEEPAKQESPVPAKAAPVKTAPAEAAPKSASSWAAQVKQKKDELELPPHPAPTSDPKPVYTDPAVPLTGEKIAITPRAEKKGAAGNRLDGTSAPRVKQVTMDEVIPYQAPPMRLLREGRPLAPENARQEDEYRAQIIEGTLRSFGVESEVKQITHGPSITRFAIQIAPGVKVSKVVNTADNLALELKTQHVRVEAPIQGTNYIGIEVPNKLVSTVTLREVLDSPEMKANPSPLLVCLGKDIAGTPVLCDLSKMPHLLIAGATGSGKSVCINSIICSLLYRTTPEQVRLIMVDPKQVELSVYNPIPHLLVPVVSDPKKAAGALAWVVQEMLERYAKFSSIKARNLAGYNAKKAGTDEVMPNIVVIIDEMADLMEVCRKDVEESIRRLAALARAAGIYMVLATQRPSVDVITGVVKNNIPSRIAFAVSSGTDSRTIIDINGAEKLMGKGDMLYKPTGATPARVQGCFVSDDEVNAIVQYIGSRYEADYDPNIVDQLENSDGDYAPDEITSRDDDGGSSGEGSFQDLLRKSMEMAVEDGQTSTSMLQRRLRIGYARAGRIIDEMEKRGVISHSEGSKPRKTLMTREEYDELMRN